MQRRRSVNCRASTLGNPGTLWKMLKRVFENVAFELKSQVQGLGMTIWTKGRAFSRMGVGTMWSPGEDGRWWMWAEVSGEREDRDKAGRANAWSWGTSEAMLWTWPFLLSAMTCLRDFMQKSSTSAFGNGHQAAMWFLLLGRQQDTAWKQLQVRHRAQDDVLIDPTVYQ